MAVVAAPFGAMPTTLSGLFNDFYTYWSAAFLLNSGGDPYDIRSLTSVLHQHGLQALAGSGYSYPIFFAELLRPLTLLPPNVAAGLFAVISLAALGLAIALLASSIPGLALDEAVLFGSGCGFWVPVSGSLFFGQANLLVLPLLVAAYRGLAEEWLIAAAALVKIYPVTGLLASLTAAGPLRDRWLRVAAALAGLAALLVAGGGVGGLNSKRSQLIGPDVYWSNQSVNGWISRLSLPSPWTVPPMPGIPVVPVVIALSAALGIMVLAVLLRARSDSSGRLALALWLGVVIAPKDSLWNFTPLVLCLAFLLPALRGSRVLLVATLAAVLAVEEQGIFNSNRDAWFHSPAATWSFSLALYGGLAIGAVTAYTLLREQRTRRQVS